MVYLSTEVFKEHCAKITSFVQDELATTLDVGDKEASGRVLLGLFMNGVRTALKLKHPTETLWTMNIKSLLAKLPLTGLLPLTG